MSDFIHLHNHSHYSLQDGACKVESLIAAAVKNNMHAVALTDHGVMYGIAEFYKKAKDAGIKPIVGMEAYIVTEGSRFDKGKDESTGKRRTKPYHHLVLLAKNAQGYYNLSKLSTLGHTEGFYYRPRIDLELLRKYKEGLVCTSACAGGVVAAHLVNNDYAKAKEIALIYKEIYGDDFYLEIQDHNMEVEKPVLEGMPKLSKELGIKLVATNDVHYIEQEHAIAHNILLLLSDREGRDYRELRYGTDQIYFKSGEEMKKLFKNYKGAIENTLEIEEKIDLKIDQGAYHFPNFPIPPESNAKSLDDYFELLAREGLEKKFSKITPEIENRFNFEIMTIKQMGFSGYFLIVQDFINASKKEGIPVGPGRGSAAGSLVAYSLGITNIDPLEYDLLFERFLNPARKSMPDIDVDFADDKRGEVIEYVKQKYGTHCVSQIITFNKMTSRAVLKDVARVLKIPIPTVNKINKYIPSAFGKIATIDEAINEVPELRWVKDSTEDEIVNLLKYSRVLEGMNRNASKHAAGVVICPEDVSNFIPLATAVSQDEIVTQYNMKEIENAGLLKMDFLGLRTLTIIRDAVQLIKEIHNVDIDIDKIPVDDEKTFQLFWKGQTTGVFQFESGPMREYLKRLKPVSIKDLSAMNALYRPGPMDYIDDFIDRKSGKKEVKYLHPSLESILKETYGIIVYQEQVIQIANKIGGMSLADADLLRRAMGKKDEATMIKQQEKFIEGAVKNDVPKNVAISIFENIRQFANYGFNKSHAVAYSYVAYQTAYLKAHYTPEFLAANLTNEFGNSTKVASFLDDCRKLKIDVLPPNINKPTVTFTVENGKIRFGMAAIKNVGINAVKEVIRARSELGKDFTSLFDFCTNVDTRTVNKRGLEGLVLAGAFDSINKNRAQLFANIETALDFGSRAHNAKQVSSTSLFNAFEDEVSMQEPAMQFAAPWTDKQKLMYERQVTGFYITGHPLRKYEIEFRSLANTRLGEAKELEGEQVKELENLEQVRVCGVITEVKTKIDKANRTMAFIKLDDFSGQCECLVFSKVFEKADKYIKEEECVFAVGKPESSGDAIKIQIEDLVSLDQIRNNELSYVSVLFDKEKYSPEKLLEVKNILEKNTGSTPFYIHLINNGSKRQTFLCEEKIKITDEVVEQFNKVLGEEALLFERKEIKNNSKTEQKNFKKDFSK
ncbi:MAG TPA: DNA polymerase III subunit alpha [Ignavibacteriaceae bacterium]|nr:DNA polymerase III subunit alpha [Ignavibacteriaceae bacterium]